jgi:hypothetical protein
VRDDVRIGLYALRRAADDVEPPFGIHPPDQWMQVRVIVVLVDAHAPLRRVELQSGQHAKEQRGVVGGHAAHRVREQMHLEVGGFPAHVGRLIAAEARLIAGNGEPVRLGIDALEIRSRGDVSFRDACAHDRDFGFARHVACNRHAIRIEPDMSERAIQMRNAFSYHRRENEVRCEPPDAPRGFQIAFPAGIERQIGFIHLLAAALEYQVAHHAVRLVRAHVVGTDHADPRAVVREHEARQRKRVLIRCRARIDDIAAVFEALIRRGVEEECVVPLDDGNHRLARARHIAAHDDPHAMFEDQLLREIGVAPRLTLRIEADEFHFAAKHAAREIDFLGGEHRRLQLRKLGRRCHAGARIQHAYPDGARRAAGICTGH